MSSLGGAGEGYDDGPFKVFIGVVLCIPLIGWILYLGIAKPKPFWASVWKVAQYMTNGVWDIIQAAYIPVLIVAFIIGVWFIHEGSN